MLRAAIPIFALGLTFVACKKKVEATRLEVELVGCSVVERAQERLCEVEPKAKLRIVARASNLRAFADEAKRSAIAARRESHGDRETIEIEVPPGARELWVEAGASDAPSATRVGISVVARPWLAEARAKRDRGDTTGARGVAKERAAAGDDTDRALATSLIARLDLAQGAIAAAHDGFLDGARRHRALGRVSDAADDTFALSFALVQRSHGYAEARRLLDEIEPIAERTPEGRARLPYYRATLLAELGDRRAALSNLTRSEDVARTYGLTRLVRNGRNLRATQLQALGRFAEATRILDELETTSDAASGRCERAELAINAGYGALREGETSGARPGTDSTFLARAERALGRAVEAARDERCGDTHLLGIALGNLAWTLYRSGQYDRARQTLDDAQQRVPAPRGTELLSWLELSALLSLEDRQRPERERVATARAAFERELAEARLLHLREAEWGALTGLATALLRGNENDAAERKLDEAEAILDEIATLVPLGAGRGSFLRDRSDSARLLVERSLIAGRPEAALNAARRARVRILASVRAALRAERLGADERARWDRAVETYRAARDQAEGERASDWKLPANEVDARAKERAEREARVRSAIDEALAVLGVRRERVLPPLAKDAVTLFVHRADARTWLFLATPTNGRVEVRALPGGSDVDDTLARALESALPADGKLRVLADLPGRDLGSLIVKGGPLGERIAIEDSLDLGEPSRSGEPRGNALVVADPLGDLSEARIEGDSVATSVRASVAPFDVTLLRGDDANATRLRAELARASFFHYAGHAVYAGHEGWDSHLRLAGGTSFELADVLTMPRVPKRVVLSSCESGAALDATGATSFGLAQAFVLGGSDAVIAPVRPIHDRGVGPLAAAVAAELVKAGADPAQALRVALQRAGSGLNAKDRWAFRVVVP